MDVFAKVDDYWRYRPVLGVIGALFIVFLIWASVSEVDQHVVANGRVVPSGNARTVQHLEGGIVEEILVKEGQTVKAGETLFLVANTMAKSRLQETRLEQQALTATQVRLEAELTEANKIVFPEALSTANPELIRSEIALIPPAVEPWIQPVEDQTSTHSELAETTAKPINVDSGQPLEEFESASSVLNDTASTPVISTVEPPTLEQSEPEVSVKEVIPADEEACIRSLLEAEQSNDEATAQTLREDAAATMDAVEPVTIESVPEEAIPEEIIPEVAIDKAAASEAVPTPEDSNPADLKMAEDLEVAMAAQLAEATARHDDSVEDAINMHVVARDVMPPEAATTQLAEVPPSPANSGAETGNAESTSDVVDGAEDGAEEEDNSPTSTELTQIEAELNETLVLGPIAVGDDVLTVNNQTDTDEAREDLSELVLAKDVVAASVNALDAANIADEDLPPPIPLVDILERALANNPEVGMALAREEQARWSVREAGAYRSPTLDLVIEAGPEYNRPATKTSDIEDITPGRNMNIRLTKLLYDGGTSVSEEQRRHQLRRSTEIETRRVIEDIVVKAIKSYMEILQNQQAARVADDFVAEMKRMVDQINVMKDSGAASKIELDFAKSRLASAIAQTGTTAAQLNDAVASLEFLTGELPPFSAVTPMKAGEINVAPLTSYSGKARNNNSEVLLNASNKSALGMKLRGQMAQYKPILTFNMKSEALADEGGNLDDRYTTEAKLKIEYFLIDGGVRKARIQKTKAQLVELDWDHERMVKDVDRRVKQSYNQITTNRLTLSATEDEIAANEELRRLNRKNLEIGDISILELIEVEERLYNSRANRDRIAAEMLRNYYELLIGSGDLPQVLSEDYMASRIEPLEQ